jgi:ribonucleotide monophosphatase NagD (HAD superfamily)
MSCNTSTIKGFKGNSTRVPDVGYFIKMFTEKKDYKIIGKPNVDLESLIPDFKSRTTCIIGDNVLTDVQQAKNSGCSSILVTKSFSFEDLDLIK